MRICVFAHLRLIEQKEHISVLAGSCWWTKNASIFFKVHFQSNPSFSSFLFSISCCWNGFGWKMQWKEVGGSIRSIHCQKSILRYINTITNNLLWWSRMTYNATTNILLEGGQVEVRRRQTTTVADDDGGGQQQHAWLGGGLRWGRTRAGSERRQRQRSGDDSCGVKKYARYYVMESVTLWYARLYLYLTF